MAKDTTPEGYVRIKLKAGGTALMPETCYKSAPEGRYQLAGASPAKKAPPPARTEAETASKS